MHFVNDPIDFFRLALIVLSMWCSFTLIRRYRKHEKEWNVKTKDYWYSLLMWTVVGFSLPLQGILLDRPLTPVLVITAAAVVVTSKGLLNRGAWGGDDS